MVGPSSVPAPTGYRSAGGLSVNERRATSVLKLRSALMMSQDLEQLVAISAPPEFHLAEGIAGIHERMKVAYKVHRPLGAVTINFGLPVQALTNFVLSFR